MSSQTLGWLRIPIMTVAQSISYQVAVEINISCVHRLSCDGFFLLRSHIIPMNDQHPMDKIKTRLVRPQKGSPSLTRFDTVHPARWYPDTRA